MSDWVYREFHDSKIETIYVNNRYTWSFFTNKNGIQSYQYQGELPEGVYRNFDKDGSPYYTNKAGVNVYLTGEEDIKLPGKKTTHTKGTNTYPLPTGWISRESRSKPGFTNYQKTGSKSAQNSAPGTLPEGYVMGISASNKQVFSLYDKNDQDQQKPIRQTAMLAGPVNWTHPSLVNVQSLPKPAVQIPVAPEPLALKQPVQRPTVSSLPNPLISASVPASAGTSATGSATGSAVASVASAPPQRRGLANPGGNTFNRCYMNATLQLLLSIPEMRSFFSNITIDQISGMALRTGTDYGDCDRKKLQQIKALKLLFDEESKQGPPIDTNALVLEGISTYTSLLGISTDPDEFPVGRQSDSNAMLGYILDAFRCFDHPLVDALVNSLKIQEKDQIGATISSLKPPRRINLINVINLRSEGMEMKTTQELIDTIQTIEKLDDDNKFINEETKLRYRPFKKLTYTPLPTTETVIIQLPRFGDVMTIPPLKKLQNVIIPDPLINLNGVTFELKGSILHLGDTRDSGHYVYMVFENGSPQFVMDDSSRVGIEGYNYLVASYILLYRKVHNLTPQSQAVYDATRQSMMDQAKKLAPTISLSGATVLTGLNLSPTTAGLLAQFKNANKAHKPISGLNLSPTTAALLSQFKGGATRRRKYKAKAKKTRKAKAKAKARTKK